MDKAQAAAAAMREACVTTIQLIERSRAGFKWDTGRDLIEHEHKIEAALAAIRALPLPAPETRAKMDLDPYEYDGPVSVGGLAAQLGMLDPPTSLAEELRAVVEAVRHDAAVERAGRFEQRVRALEAALRPFTSGAQWGTVKAWIVEGARVLDKGGEGLDAAMQLTRWQAAADAALAAVRAAAPEASRQACDLNRSNRFFNCVPTEHLFVDVRATPPHTEAERRHLKALEELREIEAVQEAERAGRTLERKRDAERAVIEAALVVQEYMGRWANPSSTWKEFYEACAHLRALRAAAPEGRQGS